MKDKSHDLAPVPLEQWQRFGTLLRERRNAAKLSHLALAHRAELSDATIKFIETARHPPSRSTLIRLLSVVELRLSWAEVPGHHESTQQNISAPPTQEPPKAVESTPDPAQFLMNLIGFDEVRLPPGMPKTLRIFQERPRAAGQTGDKNQTDGRKDE